MSLKGYGRRMAAAGAAAMLALAACAQEADSGDAAAQVSDETLTTLIANEDTMSVVSDTLDDAGLAQVFNGTAAYTILVPRDDAFEALGEAGDELRSPEQRALLVAILRDHIVPGYLTPEDIANAIELADDGQVTMTTMGDHALTFTAERTNGVITVTAEDGASARFAGDALRASNGVAIPVEGLLKQAGGEQSAGQ